MLLCIALANHLKKKTTNINSIHFTLATQTHVDYTIRVNILISCVDRRTQILVSYFSGERPTAPDISSLTVTINVGVVKLHVSSKNGTNEFYCDIDEIETLKSEWLYQVAWAQTSKLSLDRELHVSSFVQYFNKTQFRKATALTEVHLDQRGIYTMGFTVR